MLVGPSDCTDAKRKSYVAELRSHILSHWTVPEQSKAFSCLVRITQSTSGEITALKILECNDSVAVRDSIDDAIRKANPLPLPSEESCFDRQIFLLLDSSLELPPNNAPH